MTLRELFSKLAAGELSNLAMADGGVLQQHAFPAVVDYTNEALLRLHTRFPLNEKDVLVEMVEGVTNYHLTKAHSLANSEATGTPYLIDAADPFLGDVIRVVRVYNTYGIGLPLNDEEDRNSVFTPQPKILQGPRPIAGQALDVVYRAKHTTLTVDALDSEIDIPDVLEPALKLYIGHKVYNAMNTQEAQMAAANRYAQYEAICQEVVDQDVIGATISNTNTKFHKRGWV